jgi:hypothetical protein
LALIFGLRTNSSRDSAAPRPWKAFFRLILVIDVGKPLSVLIADDKCRANIFDKAAGSGGSY